MSISNSPTPQVRVRTPHRFGVVQKIWRLGDRWMSTVDHNPPDKDPQIQLYPLDQLGPVNSGFVAPGTTRIVRRTIRRPSLVRRVLALLPLTAAIVMVGLAWLNGWGL